MLTKESFVAIDHFLPLIKPIKGNLKPLFTHLQKFEPEFEQLSDLTKSRNIISLESLSDERFIDEHLKKDIIKLTKCRTVQFKTGVTTFTLDIHYKNENLDLLIDTLKYSLSFVTMLCKHSMKDIHMKYYLLDVKRVLDNDTFFDKEEVNGGSCWSGQDECEITVWRKEEILKVSIHELIHGLSYDYKQDSVDIVKHYQEKYNITSPKMNTYEAYTEIWAELLHCYLLSRFYKQINKQWNQYDLFMSNVGIEIEFSQLQSSKVLSLLSKDKHVNKETNVTAYYLIKTELYLNLQKYLEYCIKENKDIIKIMDTSKYFEYLKGLSKVNKKKYKVTSYLRHTTRMTCLEIDLF